MKRKKQPCARCGDPFAPKYVRLLKRYSTFCVTCECRNLHDGLGLPTPPALLDKYTKRPTLTKEEFYRELKKD